MYSPWGGPRAEFNAQIKSYFNILPAYVVSIDFWQYKVEVERSET